MTLLLEKGTSPHAQAFISTFQSCRQSGGLLETLISLCCCICTLAYGKIPNGTWKQNSPRVRAKEHSFLVENRNHNSDETEPLWKHTWYSESSEFNKEIFLLPYSSKHCWHSCTLCWLLPFICCCCITYIPLDS